MNIDAKILNKILANRKRKKNPNITLKLVIRSQEKRTKEEGNKNKPQTINKMEEEHTYQ